jgi:hypothetical protein
METKSLLQNKKTNIGTILSQLNPLYIIVPHFPKISIIFIFSPRILTKLAYNPCDTYLRKFEAQ